MKDKKEIVELDLTLEEYFTYNEVARKKGMLLDDFIAEVIREWLDKKEKEGNK